MNKKIFFRSFLAIFLLNIVACTDIDLSNGFSKEVKLQQSLVLPVGDATITLSDLLSDLENQNRISFDNDSILLQVSDSADVDFPKLNLGSTFTPVQLSFSPFPITAVLNPPYTFPTISTTTNIDLGMNTNIPNERIDSVWVKSMNVGFTLNSNILQASNYKIKLTFPGNKIRNRNGSPIGAIEVIPTAFNSAISYKLSNITMLTAGFPSEIPIKAELLVTSGSTPLNVGPASKVDLKVEIQSLDFDVAFGLFNPQVVGGLPHQFPIDINKSLSESTPNFLLGIKFANPRINLQLNSNAGTYLKFKVNYIKAFVKEDPTVSVDANFGGSTSVTENLQRPLLYSNVIHNFKQFDRNWGGTNLLFDLSKNYNMLEYQFTLQNNMDSINAHPQSPCFLLSDTKVKAKLTATLPLYFDKGTSIVYNDSIMNLGTNITNALDKVTVDTVTFQLVVKNGIPMKFNFEILDVYDDLGNQLALAGLNRNYIINGAEVNNLGLTTSISRTTISLNLGKSLIDEFKKIKKLRFKLTLDGKDANSSIQITKNNTIGIKAGIILKGNATFNLGSNN